MLNMTVDQQWLYQGLSSIKMEQLFHKVETIKTHKDPLKLMYCWIKQEAISFKEFEVLMDYKTDYDNQRIEEEL